MWYLVLSRAVSSPEVRMQNHEAHMEWLLDQHRAGRVLLSGPTADRAYGIYILVSPNRQEAERLAAQDPLHVAGDRVMQVFEWDVRRAMRLDGPSIAELEALAGGKT